MNINQGSVGEFKYVRHEPEKTLLYDVFANNLETWLALRKAESLSPFPEYVEDALRSFLKCGILQHGFTLLNCDKCGTMTPVAHSCKGRGLCPSCASKRSAETSIHLVDNVLPQVAFRQWVITFPPPLRFWLARSRELTNLIHTTTSNMIKSYYENVAEIRGIADPVVGGVSFLQRFGSALNLNIHVHQIIADGVWSNASGKPVFYQLPGPSDEEVAEVVEALSDRVISLLKSKGYLPEDGEWVDRPELVDPIFEESAQFTAALSASQKMKIAFGESAGLRVRRIGSGFGYEEEIGLIKGKRLASSNGFTIHANRYIGAKERKKLEDLISYCSRGPFSHKLLSLKDENNPDGDLVYSLKSPWRDGTSAIVLTQMEMIEKISALIPPPYINLTRYLGIFASAHSLRSKVILKPHVKKGYVAVGDNHDVQRMSWAKLLKRSFKLDLERCANCHAKIYPENAVVFDQPESIRKVLRLLGLNEHPPPIKPARLSINKFDFE